METYTKEEQGEIALTILSQMGNFGQMKAMIGLTNLLFGEEDNMPYLQFTFKGSKKHNRCRVMLHPSDTYIFQLYQFKPKSCTCPMTYEQKDVYCDELAGVFEQQTGLYLRLF